MKIIARKTIIEFYKKNSDAKTALEEWFHKTKEADWNCFAEVKNTFNSVDSVGNKRFVFNIKGNQYRLIALILFVPKMVYIRFIGTHKDYDKITNIKEI